MILMEIRPILYIHFEHSSHRLYASFHNTPIFKVFKIVIGQYCNDPMFNKREKMNALSNFPVISLLIIFKLA